MKVRRPAVQYHGGKWKLAPWIIDYFPPHKVYVEPFGGGASVLLRKKPSYAEVYNDMDGEIVNLFRVMRDHGRELSEKVWATPFARDEFNLSYEPSSDPVEQARRTVTRSFMGFGSNSHNKVTGFRSNSNRSGTTPAHDWANYPPNVLAIMERLRGVVIENRDAKAVMAHQDTPHTLHYVDPPYPFTTRGDDGHDYRHEMSDDDHEELAEFLKTLSGMVIISGYAHKIYDSLGWERIDRAAHADGARDRTESLYLSPNCVGGQLRLLEESA